MTALLPAGRWHPPSNVRPKGFACQMVSYGFVWVDDARWVVTGRYWLQNWNWSAVDYWKWLKTLTLGIASPAGRWFHGNDGAISGDLTRRFWPWPAIVVAPGVPSCWTFWRKATMGDWWLKLDCDDEDFISKTPMTMSWLYICIYNYIYIWMYIIIHIYIYIYWWYCFYTPKSLVCPETQTISDHWMEEHMNNIEQQIMLNIVKALSSRFFLLFLPGMSQLLHASTRLGDEEGRGTIAPHKVSRNDMK